MSFQYSFKPDKPQPNTSGDPVMEPLAADLARITHSQQEFILDFVNNQKLQARIVSSPENAKMLYEKLKAGIAAFESENGPILLPKKKGESLFSEVKRNIYRSHKVGKNLRIINPTRKRSETRRKK